MEEFEGKCYLKQAQATDNTSKQYFLFPLPKDDLPVKILNKVWSCKEQHISVYDQHKLTEKNFLSAYHYTGTFQAGDEEIIVHLYFDCSANYLGLQIKNKQTGKVIEICVPELIVIRHYAVGVSANLMSAINKKVDSIKYNYIEQFDQAVKKLESISNGLSLNNIESIEFYLIALRDCMLLCANLEKYTYHPKPHLLKIFTNTYDFLCTRVKQLQQQKLTESHLLKNENVHDGHDEPQGKDLPAAQVSTTAVIVSDEIKIKVIKQRLDALNKDSLTTQEMILKYCLLKSLFSLLGNNDISYITSVITKITKLTTELHLQLLMYVEAGNLEIVKQLSQHVDIIPAAHLFNVVARGDIQMAIFLKERFHLNLDCTNPIMISYEWFKSKGLLCDTLLMTALRNNQYEMFLWLLEQGVNPDIRNNFFGCTALMLVFMVKPFNIIYLQALLRYGANPNIGLRTEKLLVETDTQVATQLANVGFFNPVKPHQIGKTPLHFASVLGLSEAVRLLLEHGADPHQTAANHYSSYMNLVLNQNMEINPEIVERFFTAGVRVDEAHPDNQMTGLYYAAQEGRLEAVRFFIKHGADPNRPTVLLSNNLTQIVTVATAAGNVGILLELDKKTARSITSKIEEQLGKRNLTKFTPLSKAAQKDLVDIVGYLITQTRTPVTVDNAYNAFLLALLFGAESCANMLKERYQFTVPQIENQTKSLTLS